MKQTNKHSGVNTSSMFYSWRAIKNKKIKLAKFYENYNAQCGECRTRKASKEEIEKIFSLQ